MKRFIQTLIRLFFYNRVKRYRALRHFGKNRNMQYNNGEDWYEFGV